MPCRLKSVGAALACLGLAAAQSIAPDEIQSQNVAYVPPSGLALRTEVRVVEVPVVVRDESFHAVDGLTRDDFEIYDNGRKQAITGFSLEHFIPRGAAAVPPVATERPNGPPRTRLLALCFDDLHLLPPALNTVKEAGKRFVTASLSPGDRAVVVRTSRSEDVAFTNDVPALVEQIEKITPFLPAAQDDSAPCVHIAPHEAFQITEHRDPGNHILQAKMAACLPCYGRACADVEIKGRAQVVWERARQATVTSLGVIDSLVDGMAKLPGQRIVVLTSEGFLTGTLEPDVDRLMDKARRAEVIIDGLDARGLYSDASAGMAYDGMGVLASGTGGTFFHNKNDMDRGLRELGMQPETTYVLGFTPSAAPDGKFHNLKVRLAAKKSYSVEARLGYTAPAEAAAVTSTASKLDSEAMASDAVADLPASFTWEHWPGPPAITMILHLDFKLLHFKPNGDRRSQKLELVAVLRDNQGNFVAGRRSVLELNLRDTTFERFAKSGFTAALKIEAPPGSYSVRAVAEDTMEGKLAAASAQVQVK